MRFGTLLRTLSAALVAVALSAPGVASAIATTADVAASKVSRTHAGSRASTLAALRRPLLREINAARAANGQPPLRLDHRLGRAAVRHSGRIARMGVLSHASANGSGPQERVAAAGFPRRFVGEDIGVTADPRNIVAMWLASPVHREILLSPRGRVVGLGLAAGAWEQRRDVYVTADFGA